MTSLELMNKWADLYGIPQKWDSETLDSFRGRLLDLVKAKPRGRHCIYETKDTWTRSTVRGLERVTAWTFYYSDDTVETVVSGRLV